MLTNKEWSPESAGIDLTFTITFLNPGGWFYSHFTVDEQGLLGMFMGWTAMYLVGCVAYGYAQYQLYRWEMHLFGFWNWDLGIQIRAQWAYKYECKYAQTKYQSFQCELKFRVRISRVSNRGQRVLADFLAQSRRQRILCWVSNTDSPFCRSDSLHPVCHMITIAILLELANVTLQTVHGAQYATDGVGLAALQGLGELMPLTLNPKR
jgi:hypothetical protein